MEEELEKILETIDEERNDYNTSVENLTYYSNVLLLENKEHIKRVVYLQDKIDKAIEYIENNKEKQYSFFDYYEYGLYKEEINKLLDILRGEEVEDEQV